jgi:hypothetical protein
MERRPPRQNDWIGLTRLPFHVLSRWEAMLVMALIDFVGGLIAVGASEIPFVNMALVQLIFTSKWYTLQTPDTLLLGGWGSNEGPYDDSLEREAFDYQNILKEKDRNS